jgi:prefoldin subunit 4
MRRPNSSSLSTPGASPGADVYGACLICARQPGDDDDDVQVRLEDQQHINQFGRLNQRLHDVEDDLKAKSSKHELLDDASNEIILADDDEPIRCAEARARAPLLQCLLRVFVHKTAEQPQNALRPARPLPHTALRYAFGECYFECTKDQAEELIDSQKEKIEAEISVLEEEISTIKSTLSELKGKLYGRFGKNINLEE